MNISALLLFPLLVCDIFSVKYPLVIAMIEICKPIILITVVGHGGR